MTARGILLITTAFCGMAAAAALSQTETGRRTAAPNELLDPARVAASACRGSNKRNELFKPGPSLAALLAPAEAAEAALPPLLDGLGTLTLPISSDSATAQAYFDQGLRLAFAFNHGEAIRAFQAAQAADPTCAMCYWGEAWALGPNINAPMVPEAVAPAFAAIAQAQALAGDATPREMALIGALAERYSADPKAERAALDAAYADAMAAVHAGAADDATIAVLAADAAMNTQPWDYWAVDRRTPKGRTADIVAALEQALELDSNHPGAIHLYIHAVEASSTPERAEPYADRLGAQMPLAGHVVHMPSHIYYRVGRYLDSLAVNKAAVAADHAYFEQVGLEAGLYRYGYHPHNVDFLVASARMAGDGKTALDAAQGLDDLIPDQVAEEHAWIQIIKASPLFTHAQFGDAAAVLALPDPGDGFPFIRAAWRYARAVAATRGGDVESARAERAALAEIAATADLSALEAGYVPAGDVLRIADLVVEGRIAQAEGRFGEAAAAFEAAASIQAELPYMEPPYWYYPVRRSQAAALLRAGEAETAARVFQKSLLDTPNDAYALYGLMRAQEAAGDDAAAAVTAERFTKSWAGAGEPDLDAL